MNTPPDHVSISAVPCSRHTWMSLVSVGLVLLLSCSANAAPPAATIQELRNEIASGGDLNLGNVTAFKTLSFADVTIQAPSITANGAVSGTMAFGSSSVAVLVQYVEANFGGARLGKWILALKPPTKRLSDLAPAIRNTIADDLELATPILIISPVDAEVESATFDPDARAFYSDVFGNGDFTLYVKEGANLIAGAKVHTRIGDAFNMLGLNIDRFILQGALLKSLGTLEWKQAKKEGRLMKFMAKEGELRAKLLNARLEGMPTDFVVRDFSLLVTGEPAVGLEFFLTVGRGGDARDFECVAKIVMGGESDPGPKEVAIFAKTDSRQAWKDALGIKGLELKSVALEIKYERVKTGPPNVGFGVGGEMRFGNKYVTVAGGLKSRAGALIGFFRGSIDSLSVGDIVAVANDLGTAASGQRAQQVTSKDVIDFELRDVAVNYAPLGGSDDLGVESGVGLKGQMYLFGSPLASVDGLIDAARDIPKVSIEGSIEDFDLGLVSLKGADLDVQMDPASDNHFRMKGDIQLLGAQAKGDVSMSPTLMSVSTSGKIAGLFEVDYMLKSSPVINPSWEMEAGFKDGFTNDFKQTVSADIENWAKQAKRDFDQAQADLNKAKAEVAKINVDIENTRAQVRRERQININALTKAQQDVDRITADINRMRNQVKRERSVHLQAINNAKREVNKLDSQIDTRRDAVKAQRVKDIASYKRAMDRANSSYKAAQSVFSKALKAYNAAKGLDKIGKGLDKDAKGIDRDAKKVAYDASKTAYNVANAAINKIPVDADPAIVALFGTKAVAQATLSAANDALRAIHGTAPIDADPRIAGMIGAQAVAAETLRGLRNAYRVVEGVTVDADPRVAALFAARDTANFALDRAKEAVQTTSDATQLGSQILAAGAAGKLITLDSARLKGKLAVFDGGGKIELQVAMHFLEKPQNLNLAVSTADFKTGNIFDMVTQALLPANPNQPAQNRGQARGFQTNPNTRPSGNRNQPQAQNRFQNRTPQANSNTNGNGQSTQPRQYQRPQFSSGAPSNSSTRQGNRAAPSNSNSLNQQQTVFESDINGLREDLGRLNRGANWIGYLQFDELKRMAATQPEQLDAASRETLRKILTKFDKVDGDPEYQVISQIRNFRRVRNGLKGYARSAGVE